MSADASKIIDKNLLHINQSAQSGSEYAGNITNNATAETLTEKIFQNDKIQLQGG